MKQQLSKEEVVQGCRNYFKRLMDEAKPRAFTLNISLTSNPFIKQRDGFKYLVGQLKQYNQRVEKGTVQDPYEMLSYQKIHSMLSDVAQIGTRQDQITALDEMCGWFKDQQRLVKQRYDQGNIRYEMSKQYRDALKHMPEKEVEVEEEQLNIPYFMIERIIEPYRQNQRTLHSQYENPTRRLIEYKVKTLNILNLAASDNQKDESKPPRVLYPMPPKYEPPHEQEPEVKAQQGQEGQPPIEGGEPPIQGQQGAPPAEEAPQQPGMDLGGLGQEGGDQPDEDEPPEEVPDKLRPKNPIYVEAVKAENQRKYNQGYMHFKGNEGKSQRNMDLRYLKLYHDTVRKNREEVIQTEVAHQWAKRKARIAKDMQKKLEQMKFKPEFSFSNQPFPPEQRLAPQDELKYGFTTGVRNRPKTHEVDLTLPNLRNTGGFNFDEKSIRRDRISSLRNKFSKVLNLAEHQERDAAPSLCQYSSRRRGLSEIIRNHSHSKERLHQLEEVSKIKEKLTKVKVNVNIKALSRGLCLPDSEDYFSAQSAREFPTKQLPSNPDMVETKKKKKKK